MHGNQQSRKYQLTINNPQDKGMTHEYITEKLTAFKSTIYFCMADEIGVEENTPHTHIYVVFSSPVRFSTVKRAFPTAHIEAARGTSEENRAYILKEGKWKISSKSETSVDGSFEEWGDMPQERQGQRRDLAELYAQIKDGASDFEILENNPNNLRHINLIDKVRQAVAKEAVKSAFRELTVTYIYGETGVGKTRYVMDKFGYENVFRVTDYKHPFDNYAGQQVICFDEFASNFSIRDFLTYLDGYPLELPCRYANKWAAYNEVFIISNAVLDEQYQDSQFDNPSVWHALLRRLTKIIQFLPNGKTIEYFIDNNYQILPVNSDELPSDIPFDSKT